MDNGTPDDLQLAIMKVDLLLKTKQARWETPKALAMMLLAAAAIAAAGGVAGWLLPSHSQQITVHFDQPLAVKLVPP